MKAQNLRYAALAAITAANAYRAHRLGALRLALGGPDAKPDLWPCTITATRPHGEVVHCFLPAGHGGFHMGRADGVARYTWPDSRSDEDSSCGCDCTKLQADIAQTTPSRWSWRIFDVGCDAQERLFALGSSDDLGEAYDDVATTMRVLTETGGFTLGKVEFSVVHHAVATVGQS